jgi:hypothetical protein
MLFPAQMLASGDTIVASNKFYTQSANIFYQPGMVIGTHSFVKGDNPTNKPISFYQSFTAQYSIHTDGRKLWQQMYGYPVWGFGTYGAFFPKNTQLGGPIAMYTFFSAPIKKWEKWCINYEVDFGFAFNWKNHDLLENGYYYPIGSHVTVFFDFGLNSTIQISKKTDLYFGFHFTHFSNGAVKLPNDGLNMISLRGGIRYVYTDRPEYITSDIPEFKKEWEWVVYISPSYKQTGFTYENANKESVAKAFNYGVFTVSSGINRQISYKIKLGGGTDFSYNEAYGADTVMVNGVPEKAPSSFSNKFLIGIFPSFELVVNKLSLLIQPGVYIYKPKTDVKETPDTYQRVGLRLYLSDHLIAGVNLRAYNFSKADFIEFNVGYTLHWYKIP